MKGNPISNKYYSFNRRGTNTVLSQLPEFYTHFARKDLSWIGTSDEHPKVLVYRSLLHRLQSIYYNIDTFYEQFDSFLHEINEQVFIKNELQTQCYMTLIFLFENIIFSLVSGVDYFASFIGLAYLRRNNI